MNVLSKILKYKVISIIRDVEQDNLIPIMNALYNGGIRVVEITMSSPKVLSSIEMVSDYFGDKMLIGAGTVLDSESARAALLAGAKFILSPTVDLETIKITKKYGAVSIPGAFTPTEILQAYQHGADIVKVFPTSLGAKYIKDIRGPLPQIPLLPTGGVSLENLSEFFKAGAVGAGIGSSLVDTKIPVDKKYLKNLEENSKLFVAIASQFDNSK